MFDRVARIPITLLLSALLMGGSFVPPGMRHQHDLPQGRLEGHAHEHFRTPSHGHSHSEHSFLSLAEDLWHLHFVFFGVDVTLPDSAPSEEETQRRNGQVVYLRAAEPLSLIPSTTAVVNWPPSAQPAGFSNDAGPLQTVAAAPPPVTAPPLCDRARLERSGVLLT